MASAANPTLSERFLTFINPHLPTLRLADPAVCTLLAVSGGLDSVVMVHLFHNAGFRFAIAHVNFGLRGHESDGDAQFVAQLAGQYGVPFHVTRFIPDQFAARPGVSIQMAARQFRYNWFEQIRGQNNYPFVATAHHRNDVLETLLLNLTRGTGLAGLRGIAFRRGSLIRPLLFANRADLETYARHGQLPWREDRSNSSDAYARNRIRHRVVPVLTSINPGLLHTLDGTLDRLRAAETLVQHELDRSAPGVVTTTGMVTQIDLILLRQLAEPAFRLAHWLQPFGFTYQQATAVWQAIGQGRGQEFRSATHRLRHEPDRLTLVSLVGQPAHPAGMGAPAVTLTAVPAQPVLISAGHWLRFRGFARPPDFVPPANPGLASFDADALTLPLTIRRWQAGDRFRPLGLNGQKLVSDLLTDRKIARPDRDQVWVLLSGDRIAWVIGQRLDHRFRVTAQTRRIVQIERVTG